jgi:hypothetical protein
MPGAREPILAHSYRRQPYSSGSPPRGAPKPRLPPPWRVQLTISFNNLLLADLNADLGKLADIPGASFGAAVFRFDGHPTNQQAGLVTGYNGLTGASPLASTYLAALFTRSRSMQRSRQ